MRESLTVKCPRCGDSMDAYAEIRSVDFGAEDDHANSPSLVWVEVAFQNCVIKHACHEGMARSS